MGKNNSEGAAEWGGCICRSLIRRGHRSWSWVTHSTGYGCSPSASVRPFITTTYKVQILTPKPYLLWEFEANKLLSSRPIKPDRDLSTLLNKFRAVKLWKPRFCLAENTTFFHYKDHVNVIEVGNHCYVTQMQNVKKVNLPSTWNKSV
jgi:hypothetical protein